MDRSIAMLVIGLVFGGGIGFVIAAGNGVTLGGHDHDAQSHEMTQGMTHEMAPDMAQGMTHGHEDMLNLEDEATSPALTVELIKDSSSGWNLHLLVSNFVFAPENAGQPHVPGQGHAHVYVNGAKIARLYGKWMHIPMLPEGASVEVTLNSNDHRVLAIGDRPIKASAAIN